MNFAWPGARADLWNSNSMQMITKEWPGEPSEDRRRDEDIVALLPGEHEFAIPLAAFHM